MRGLGAELQIDLGEVVLRIEADLRRQAGIAGIEDAVELLLGAVRVIAQRLHLVAGFRPGALQVDALFTQQFLGVADDADFVPLVEHADEMVRQAGFAQRSGKL